MSIVRWLTAILICAWIPTAMAATLKQDCKVRDFTERNIAEIIARERSLRVDLPPPFEEQTVKQFRDGCYYIYQEWKKPNTPGMNNIFVLDQYGVIVDVTDGGH